MGDVRLRNRETHEVILRPTPTSDPNDPLNWPQWFKYYLTGLTCVAIMMCNFLAAGPTIAIVETALEFLPNLPLSDAIAKVAFFFTTTALLQGIGNFIWIPLANKFGRRPVYVTSYLIYLASTVWLVYEQSYAGFLAGRILMGFGSGAADTIAPLTITDLFFLHERGAVMCAYTAFLSMGVGLGMLVSGFIVKDHDWRAIYQVSAVIITVVTILIITTFPETTYRRPARQQEPDLPGADTTAIMLETKRTTGTGASVEQPRRKESFWRMMRLFKGVQTEESMTKMFFRPLGLILLPPVLWAALVQAVTVGFLVAVTSNVASAFESAYGFEPYQIGLCFAATLVGSLLGIPAGGHLGDMVADIFTRRNGGIREPEMRLPAIAVSAVTTPLALVLFGVGIGDQLHWICPTIGLGLCECCSHGMKPSEFSCLLAC
jgi:MFS family permease